MTEESEDSDKELLPASGQKGWLQRQQHPPHFRWIRPFAAHDPTQLMLPDAHASLGTVTLRVIVGLFSPARLQAHTPLRDL